MAVVKFIIVFALALFFVGACSPDAPVEVSSTSSTEALNEEQREKFDKALKPVFVHFGELEDKISLFDFECEDCPLSFGHFVATQVDDSKPKPANHSINCQGGLVDKDLFLTNRHCLPITVQEVGDDCSDVIKVVFPKVNDTAAEIVKCQEVVSLFKKPETLDKKDPQPDWVLLKLEKELPERMTALSRTSLPDQTEVVAFVPLTGQNSDFVELKKITCHSQQKTLSLPEYSEDVSPIALFKCDQDITRGFSGSLLFQKIEEELKPIGTLSHIWDKQQNKETILVSKKIIASLAQCFDGEDPLDEKCEFDPQAKKSLKDQLVRQALEPMKEKIAQQLSRYKSNGHPIVWEELDMDKVKAGETTPQIFQFWQNQVQQTRPAFLSEETRALYTEALVQFQPKCLKKEFVPEDRDEGETKTHIPVITLRIRRTTENRVEAIPRVRHVPVIVLKNRDNLSEYTFQREADRPAFRTSDRRILSSRFNHLAASVPVCP